MLRFADVTHHLLQGKASPSIVSEVASASSSYSDDHVYMSVQNLACPQCQDLLQKEEEDLSCINARPRQRISS